MEIIKINTNNPLANKIEECDWNAAKFLAKLLKNNQLTKVLGANSLVFVLMDNDNLVSFLNINGFIIAYNRQLSKNGLRDYRFYNECLKKMTIDFSKEAFPYTSSQYRKFSTLILEQAFGFTEEELETI